MCGQNGFTALQLCEIIKLHANLRVEAFHKGAKLFDVKQLLDISTSYYDVALHEKALELGKGKFTQYQLHCLNKSNP